MSRLQEFSPKGRISFAEIAKLALQNRGIGIFKPLKTLRFLHNDYLDLQNVQIFLIGCC